MKGKIIKCILSLLSLICILAVPVTPVYAEKQGTDGTEMQLMEAQNLEIQLGTDWAGVEFALRTDAGMYPGTVKVGDDGVLRMEIGGSKNYILSCMNSTVQVPSPTQAPATTDADKETVQTESIGEESEPQENTVAGIPVWHLVLFCGGMILAVGSLITMHVLKKRREADSGYDGEGDEEDE